MSLIVTDKYQVSRGCDTIAETNRLFDLEDNTP